MFIVKWVLIIVVKFVSNFWNVAINAKKFVTNLESAFSLVKIYFKVDVDRSVARKDLNVVIDVKVRAIQSKIVLKRNVKLRFASTVNASTDGSKLFASLWWIDHQSNVMLVVGKNNEMKKLQAPLVHSKNLTKTNHRFFQKF